MTFVRTSRECGFSSVNRERVCVGGRAGPSASSPRSSPASRRSCRSEARRQRGHRVVNVGAEPLRPPPRLEALLRGPELPHLLDARPVRALDDDLRPSRRGGWRAHCRSCSLLLASASTSLSLFAPARLRSDRAAPPTAAVLRRATRRSRGTAPASGRRGVAAHPAASRRTPPRGGCGGAATRRTDGRLPSRRCHRPAARHREAPRRCDGASDRRASGRHLVA